MRLGNLGRAAWVIAVSGAVAHADVEAGKRLAAEAEQLAASNQMIPAAAKYREAFAAEPRPEYICNVGVAYLKAQDLPRAQRYLNDCLQLGGSLDRAFVANVRKVLDGVETKLVAGTYSPVDLFVEPTTATIAVVGGMPFDEPLVGSRRAWFPRGTYKLTFHAEGYADQTVDVAATTATAVRISVKLERPAVEVTPPAPIEPVAGPAPAPLTPPPPPPSAPSKLPAILATAATVGLGVAGGLVYLSARGKVDDAEAPGLTDEAFEDLKSSAKSRQRISWVLGGAAGLGALASGYLWYRATRAPSTTVEVNASGDGAAVLVRGRF